MEKKVTFGRIFWPSLIAGLIIAIIGVLLFVFSVFGIISSFESENTFSIADKTVLHLTLEGEINDQSATDIDPMNLTITSKTGLPALLYGFHKAAEDEKIKGIFLEIKGANCGIATAKEIRNAINEFESSGKFVIAYLSGEAVTQKQYYIASAANKIYGFPTSMMEFVGLGSEMMFFKKTLDMLEVEAQVIRGKNNDFKSAVEPFFRTEMSDSSRHQTERYLQEIWKDMLYDIAKDRKTTSNKLNLIAENMSVKRISDATKFNLIDGVKYRDEVINMIGNNLNTKEDINLEKFEKYASEKFKIHQQLVSPNIAVVLAEGDISVGGDGLTSNKICKYLREIRKNDKIKALVFRINSPGGSALASDEIWREIKLCKQKMKVVVSMGDVAASGGYYIAAPADYIFAQPTTITGSIGVFGVIPYTGKMLESKLGISFDRAQTNKHAVISTNRKLNEEEIGFIQSEIDVIYQEFLERVAEGRKMNVNAVNSFARGRVWTGSDAKKIGLVDELGGLEDAIKFAKTKAAVSESKLVFYPKIKDDPFQPIIEILENENNENVHLKKSNSLPDHILKYYSELKKIESYQGIQMRLPFNYYHNIN